MSEVLAHWNAMVAAEAENEIVSCCGSRAWARGMVAGRPIADERALLAAADEVWRGLSQQDQDEAFRSHPRIGESRAEKAVDARSATWSAQEQSALRGEDLVKAALAEGNREYEKRFGRIFIVCATGKSGAEMLEILQRRLKNDPDAEFREATEQQRQITQIRLKKWLAR